MISDSKKQAGRVVKAHAARVGNSLTEPEVVELIRAKQGDTSLRDFAEELGVTAPYITDIYKGRRSPGPKVLKYFGIGKMRQVVVQYVFFKK
jgi:transcriptional regulator with XRE-family HTH domain